MIRSAIMTALFVSASCTMASPVSPDRVVPQDLNQSSDQWTMSGTVWIYGASGLVRAMSGTVFGWIDEGSSGHTTGRINIGSDGRYRFEIPRSATRVRVKATGNQPCAVTIDRPTASATADVFIVEDKSRLGGNLPAELAATQPTLSGVVYERVGDERVPLSGAWVTLDGLGGLGLMVADTLSDADGHYTLCGVPYAPGLSVIVGKSGYQIFEYYKDLTGQKTLDIEMRK